MSYYFGVSAGVEEMEARGGAGDGGVEPAVEVDAQRLGWDAAHVDENVGPLSALVY